MANELAEKILDYLANHEEANSLDLADLFNLDHQKIIGAIKSLESIGDMVIVEQTSRKKWELTAEGQHVVEHGSHEAAVYNAIPENGISQAEIMKSVPYAKIGFSKALAAGWIKIDKSNNSVMVRKAVPSIIDSIQNHLKDFSNIPDNAKGDYKKRKLLQEIIIKSVNLRKGSNFSTKIVKQEADLTADLLVNGVWKEKKFKPYNFDALGSALEVGHLHPLLKVRSEFRKIFLEMGFIEMSTNNYVESSFWNFDALFQPQQHPARDAHDTFFISEPRTSSNFPKEYLEKVKQVHSKGGYGSQGYGYDWKIEEAQKNLLRTHTTAVSARMLYKLMQQGEFKPVRYFSIDRVFRNETLDATHLAEFHQVEGVVADYNLTLGDLIGTLYEFFKKLGITQLEFKPAYNPYTEPSMEIFCFHNGLGKWIEIGNSGLFRPELLQPMGFPENVNVIAWGLSLERPTMIKYGINNIRDLVGPKVDLQMVHDNPLCRLQKTTRKVPVSKDKVESLKKRWDNILEELQNIQLDLNKATQELNDHPKVIVKQNLTIFCDPQWPIRSLETLLGFLKRCLMVNLSIHVHSSVEKFPPALANFCSEYTKPNGNVDVSIVLIWKSVGIDPVMKLPRMHEIVGEVNIARYMNRLIELTNSNLLKYESNGPLYANQIDSSLETIHQLLRVKNKSKLKAIFKRTKTRYALGNEFSVVDILLDSVQQCHS